MPRTVARRLLARCSVSIVGAVAAAALLAGCVPPPSLWTQKQQVDALIAVSANTFAARARDSAYTGDRYYLTWTTDGCSNGFLPDHLNDTGLSFDFTNACWHHDFGYRNYRRFVGGGIIADREAARQRIDTMFYDDMKAHCASRSVALKPTCYARAALYYELVRQFGSIPPA